MQRNLIALGLRHADLAQRLRDQEPAPLAWSEAKAGGLTATLDTPTKPVALASRYDPEGEARTKGYTWMQTISGFFVRTNQIRLPKIIMKSLQSSRFATCEMEYRTFFLFICFKAKIC